MTHAHSDQFPRIRGWIQKEAGGRTPEGILAYVTEKYDELFAAADAVSADQAAKAPAAGEWSAVEALQHVVEWNWQVGEDILHVCLMGERPANSPPTFPADRDELIRRGRESLDSVWAHVSAADPQGFLELTWEHPFFGQLNWREWFFFLGVHAMDHTGQIVAAGGAPNA